jgi:hypothetical protein
MDDSEDTAKERVPDQNDGRGAEEPGFTRLTERDKDILAVLALTRYLTAEQVHRLFFDGKRMWLAYKRLKKLTEPRGQPPYLEKLTARTYDGRRFGVWKPTANALTAAALKTSQIRELPVHDVSARHLEHAVQMNELFVELWRAPAKPARARHPAFRWIPSDALRLAYGEYEVQHGRQVERFIRPDAALDVLPARKRYFLECEMGTHTIVPQGSTKPDATINKAARYQKYLCGPIGMRGEVSPYSKQYPDGLTGEVLFLVLTAGRANSVNAALDEWRREQQAWTFASMTALTFDDAAARLRALGGLPPLSARAPGDARASASPEQAASPFWTEADVRTLLRFAEQAMESIHGARVAIRRLSVQLRAQAQLAEPPYPKDLRQVETLLRQIDHLA